MIKCPKCLFEQPEDIYCAQCGVNMKTFVPKKPNLFLSFLRNQPLHLAILCIAIISFVVYDQLKTSKPSAKIDNTQLEKVYSQTAATADDAPVDEQDTHQNPAAETEPHLEAQKTESLPMAAHHKASRFKKADANEANGSRTAGDAGSATGAKTSLQILFFQANKTALAELQKDAQSANFNGDASGGIVWKKKLNLLKNSGDLKPVSNTRYKLDGQPITVFKGQRTSEGSKSIGLYFQINTLKNDTAVTQIEIKSWGTLKTQENDETLFSSDMTLNGQYAAYIGGFLPKDKVFSDEEKTIFEADRALKIYNQDDFWDGSTDLIMVIELPESP